MQSRKYQSIENTNKNTNLRTAERHLKRTRDTTSTILRPTRKNKHWLTLVAALSLEDPHAPAWGPFFFVVYNMLQDASLWDPYIHIPSNDLPTLQAVKFVLKGRGRTIVKTAWELKIPRSLGGDGGHG